MMLRLALQTLRFRRGGFLASFVALFVGAAVLTACGSLMETGILHQVPPERLTAAPIVVTGDQRIGRETLPERVRLPSTLVPALSRLPGVAAAVPDLSFPVSLLADGRPAVPGGQQGHGWAAGTLGGDPLCAGAAPEGADQVVLDGGLADRLGLRIGDRLQLAVAGGSRAFLLVGTLAPPRPGTAVPAGTAAPVLLFSDAEAAALLGQDGRAVDSIAVVPAPGAEFATVVSEVRAAVTGQPALVLTGEQRGIAEFPGSLETADRLVSMSAVFGGLSALVALFVVSSTLALLVRQRGRELALLRAVGSTPRQLRRMVLLETLVVAVAAAGAAAVPGRALGHWMLAELAGGGVIAPQLAYASGWLPPVVAAGVVLLSSIGAALIAARGTALARPSEALGGGVTEPRRWWNAPRLVLGLLCLGGGAALAVVTATVMHGTVASSTAAPAAMLWASGLALFGPGTARLLTGALTPLRLLFGNAGYLAVRNARARTLRTAASITPVMLATGLATALILLTTAQGAATATAARQLLRADAVVGSSAGGLSPALVGRVAGLPGVRAASADVDGEVLLVSPPTRPGRPVQVDSLPAQGVTADAAGAVFTPVLTAGSFRDLVGESIVLPTSWTRQPDRAVGDTLTLDLGDGTPVPLHIVGSFAARPGFESAFLPAALAAAHSSTGLLPRILVSLAPGTSPSGLAREIDSLAGRPPGIEVSGPATASAGSGAGAGAGSGSDGAATNWISYLLVATVVGYALIALVNTLTAAAAERSGEFAALRLVGSTRRQVLAMMSVEALLVALAGAVLGTAVAAATLAPFDLALTGSVRPLGPVWICPAVLGTAAVLTLAATLLPTALVLRTRPQDVVIAA